MSFICVINKRVGSEIDATKSLFHSKVSEFVAMNWRWFIVKFIWMCHCIIWNHAFAEEAKLRCFSAWNSSLLLCISLMESNHLPLFCLLVYANIHKNVNHCMDDLHLSRRTELNWILYLYFMGNVTKWQNAH